MTAGRRWWMLGAMVGSVLAGGASPAQTSRQPLDGRAIYQGFMPLAAGIDATSYRMPPLFAACARCHGVVGEGGREGSVVAPPLSWAALFSRRGGLPPFATADVLLHAVTDGVGRDGGKLGAAMPRYRLSAQEASALLAYLERVGGPDDNPPGVTQTSVRLATVLPLSGPGASAGSIVRRGLEETFSEVNRGGGIHGRTIDFTVADVNAAADTSIAPAGMVASSPYAVVGGMWRSADATLDGLLAQRRIGKIASLIPKKTVSDLDAWDADLLPPLDVQHAALIKALHACPVNGVRLGVPIVMDAAGDDDRSVRWFDDVTGLVAAREASAGGCYALGLAASAGLRIGDDATWRQHIVLPFPGSVLRSPDIWLTLGRAAARLAVELLSRSGARLHEASLLDAARLRSFEPIEGAPTRFTGTRRYGWDADVLIRPAKPVERDHTTNKDSNQGG